MGDWREFDWRSQKLSWELARDQYLARNNHGPKDRLQALGTLRELVKDTDRKTQLDDQYLGRFLYARKFDAEEAFKLLNDHDSYRSRNPAFFDNLDLEAFDVRAALGDGLPAVLDQRDRRGRRLLVLASTNWSDSYGLLAVYRALLYTLEVLLEDVTNQANGFVLIVDWTGLTMRQATRLEPKLLRSIVEGLQDCYPARFKAVHFVAQPWYVDAVLAVIKPFLRDKTKSRMFVHGNNLGTLLEHIARDVLPTELGGEQPSYNPQSWLDTLTQRKEQKR